MTPFQVLGDLVEARWRAENYNEDVFADLAAAALAGVDLPTEVSPWDIVKWVLAAPALPYQFDRPSSFSDAAITLYAGRRFTVDAYYWLDGTTTVHQHSFSGAFQVLHGSSLHSTYSFEPRVVATDHLVVGTVRRESLELLQTKDIRRIEAGQGYIHSLFHLERPSVSIAVRTHHDARTAPQYTYLRPHLAYDPAFEDPALTKQLQALAVLLAAQHAEADAIVSDFLARADLHTTFGVLQMLYLSLCQDPLAARMGVTVGHDRFATHAETARSRHGDLVDLLVVSIHERARQETIARTRRVLPDPGHRLFLALLMNCDVRAEVLSMVRRLLPDRDPIEKVLDWINELAFTNVLGGDASGVLRIEDFDDRYVAVLECLLHGAHDEELGAAIERRYSSEYAAHVRDLLPEMCRRLRSSPLLKPLLCR